MKMSQCCGNVKRIVEGEHIVLSCTKTSKRSEIKVTNKSKAR